MKAAAKKFGREDLKVGAAVRVEVFFGGRIYAMTVRIVRNYGDFFIVRLRTDNDECCHNFAHASDVTEDGFTLDVFIGNVPFSRIVPYSSCSLTV
jgi:hypothetical protein